MWATHQQQDYCHNRVTAWYTWGPGQARVEFGPHTYSRSIATLGLLRGGQGEVLTTHQQQDYCHNRIVAWYIGDRGQLGWNRETHQQKDYCQDHCMCPGQHTNNRIIATTELLHGTHGDRGEPGWSLGNTQTTGLLRQQDCCMVARVEHRQHTKNRITATIRLLYDSQGRV